MFDLIQDSFQKLKRKITGFGKLSNKEIESFIRDLRRTLLEADVHYQVAKNLTEKIKKKIENTEVTSALSPGKQVMKIVYEELVKFLGEKPVKIEFKNMPSVILLVGLQGTGKTTTAAKLAFLWRNRKPLLVPADTKRPAAAKQLQLLARRAGADFFAQKENNLNTCLEAIKQAKTKGNGVVIIDSAGRLHIDEEMMEELKLIKDKTKPEYTLLVIDGLTGQDALRQAEEFSKRIGIDGGVVTKMDGDPRGGVILSFKSVTEKPVFFIGTGERIDMLEHFDPTRIAVRVMGEPDVLSIAEEVEKITTEELRKKTQKKFLEGKIDFEDLLVQIRTFKKMGGFSKIAGMIPGLKQHEIDEDELKKKEAIILSMTPEERRNPGIIDGSRRARIARGSGTTPHDVNVLLQELNMINKMSKMIKKSKPPWFGKR